MKNKVLKFYDSLKKFDNHRYKSWEHCHSFFVRIKDEKLSEDKLNLAQLHLAFYLASWGMYRGSSFILQKDYTIFSKIVKTILDQKYSLLWNIEKNLDKKEKLIELFVDIYEKIENELKIVKKSIKQHPDLENSEKRYLSERKNISYTLMTKILLGTIGCIPAYDRFFIDGLNKTDIQKKFSAKKSFRQLLKFYEENEKEINILTKECKGYTPMKIIDMYFWIIGYNNFSEK